MCQTLINRNPLKMTDKYWWEQKWLIVKIPKRVLKKEKKKRKQLPFSAYEQAKKKRTVVADKNQQCVTLAHGTAEKDVEKYMTA